VPPFPLGGGLEEVSDFSVRADLKSMAFEVTISRAIAARLKTTNTIQKTGSIRLQARVEHAAAVGGDVAPAEGVASNARIGNDRNVKCGTPNSSPKGYE
jgi:hypothetical protein